jgi:ketosteroid isomerase-like protein
MTHRTPSHLATVLLVSLAACQSAPSELTEADRAAIQQATDQFVEHIRSADYASVSMLYTEDARFMPPNQPTVSGRSAIQEWMQGMPAVTQFSLTNDQIAGQGDMAYVIGRFVMGLEGMPVDSGKFIELRQRGADGVWRITADIFNSSMPVPEM